MSGNAAFHSRKRLVLSWRQLSKLANSYIQLGKTQSALVATSSPYRVGGIVNSGVGDMRDKKKHGYFMK